MAFLLSFRVVASEEGAKPRPECIIEAVMSALHAIANPNRPKPNLIFSETRIARGLDQVKDDRFHHLDGILLPGPVRALDAPFFTFRKFGHALPSRQLRDLVQVSPDGRFTVVGAHPAMGTGFADRPTSLAPGILVYENHTGDLARFIPLDYRPKAISMIPDTDLVAVVLENHGSVREPKSDRMIDIFSISTGKRVGEFTRDPSDRFYTLTPQRVDLSFNGKKMIIQWPKSFQDYVNPLVTDVPLEAYLKNEGDVPVTRRIPPVLRLSETPMPPDAQKGRITHVLWAKDDRLFLGGPDGDAAIVARDGKVEKKFKLRGQEEYNEVVFETSKTEDLIISGPKWFKPGDPEDQSRLFLQNSDASVLGTVNLKEPFNSRLAGTRTGLKDLKKIDDPLFAVEVADLKLLNAHPDPRVTEPAGGGSPKYLLAQLNEMEHHRVGPNRNEVTRRAALWRIENGRVELIGVWDSNPGRLVVPDAAPRTSN